MQGRKVRRHWDSKESTNHHSTKHLPTIYLLHHSPTTRWLLLKNWRFPLSFKSPWSAQVATRDTICHLFTAGKLTVQEEWNLTSQAIHLGDGRCPVDFCFSNCSTLLDQGFWWSPWDSQAIPSYPIAVTPEREQPWSGSKARSRGAIFGTQWRPWHDWRVFPFGAPHRSTWRGWANASGRQDF